MGTNPEPKDAFARVRVAYGAVFVLAPIIIVAAAVLNPLPRLFGLLLVMYLIGTPTIVLTLAFWPCPHCGKAFFGGWNRSSQRDQGFSRSKRACAHCGLMWSGISGSGGGAA